MPSKDVKTTSPSSKTTVSSNKSKTPKIELVEDVEVVEDEVEEVEVTQLATKVKTSKDKEPVPENTLEDVAENKSEFESYAEISKAKQVLLASIKASYTRLAYLEKEANKFHSKTEKDAKKKNKRVNTDPNKKPAGFETPVLIPDKFYKFISSGLKKNKFSEEKTKELEEKNLQDNSMIPRSIVTRMVYDYIKHLNLYEENAEHNKRFIKPDEAIKTLFSMTDTEEIGFFNFQTYVCRLFPKSVKAKKSEDEVEEADEADEAEEAEEVEEVEVEAEPEPVKKKSGKSKTASAV